MEDGACRDKSGFVSRSRSAGFTLIELLIVLVFISILSSVGIGYYFNYYRQTLLKSAAETMSSFVYIVQQKAIGQEETSQWGIHFENPLGAEKPFYASFKGATYATPIEKMFLDNALDFEYPADGTSVDIVFSKISGKPSPAEYKKVYLKLATGESMKALRVSPLGVISLDDGETGWWKLEEGSGPTAIDSSVFRQSGTISGGGASWTVSGQTGKAVAFSGTPGCSSSCSTYGLISIPTFTFSGSATICLWAKPNLSEIKEMAIHGSVGTGAFEFYQNGTTAVLRGGGSSPSVSGAGALSVGNWKFVCGVVNGTTGQVYGNGKLLATGSILAPGVTARDITIGAYSTGAYSFNGTIDDVRVYDRALSGVEIERIYQLTK